MAVGNGPGVKESVRVVVGVTITSDGVLINAVLVGTFVALS
ncbi:MAG: hypothetical protein BroJett015_28930 [Chloroflexota bacterium]|nr:MAG: hypothetical protein BroJett015_28930 [Chloroflexota bacterium]